MQQLRLRTAVVTGILASAALTVPLAAAPASAAGHATINVVHGIPKVAVKVCVDGAKVADGFRYGDAIAGARLSAGKHRVKLVAAHKPCTAPAILKSSYDLHAGRNYTVVANLDAHGGPNLAAFGNNVRPTARHQARLTVRHTAQAPAVNVWAGSAKLIGGSDFTWGRSATLAAPRGSYRVKVTLPGSRKPVIGPQRTTLRQGRAYQVYAVGSPDHYRLVTVGVRVGTR
jgi:hypothetical protein